MHTSGIVSLAAFVSVLAAGVPDVASQGSSMSPSERAIVEHVRAHTTEALALLERAVNINSGDASRRSARGGRLFGAGWSLGFNAMGGGAAFKRASHLVMIQRPVAHPLIGFSTMFGRLARSRSSSASAPRRQEVRGCST
jgi:hypothetical protein